MNPNITENTLVDLPRLQFLKQYIINKRDIPGAIAEVGVYKGGTAYLICETAQTLEKRKPILLFDTFTGMPQTDLKRDLHRQGDFADTSISSVQKLLKEFEPIICQGVFPNHHSDTFNHCTFSVVHLDCDIYSSVYASLCFFYPRMSPGGIIILDDYNEPNCPGAKEAADAFCTFIGNQVYPTAQSQAVIYIP